MRDDFLMHCNKHEALKPIFSELTPLDPPVGPALRRALVQPATKCGYRFEDDGLVDEMLAEVEGERGALPLLAFAAARLWEKRDRETGLLTRQAYHDIGGVGGALARHAEATIDRIGSDHIAIVRELFRNLVTAEGTRAVRAWDELLSVFDTGEVSRAGIKPAPTKEPLVGAGSTPARETAKEVLHELIDARLLTSYEVHEEDREPTRRVEIIHESLLANWPRLVGWQTQDADSVRMRDELRQAARTWDEHERSDDLLWTGSAYREFSVWRERYPGGLTETEEGFARAMNSLATRRRRRRRIAVAAAFVILLGVLAIIGGFWRRSVTEARRAEAANLFSLAQLQLENHPTATIAYAIASLELADNREVRRLAVEALWLGPTEIRLPTPAFYLYSLDFSADGRWLATADPRGGGASLWPSDGDWASGRFRRAGSCARSRSATGVTPSFSSSPPTASGCSPTLRSRQTMATSSRFGRGQSWAVSRSSSRGSKPPRSLWESSLTWTRPGLELPGPMAVRFTSRALRTRRSTCRPRSPWSMTGPSPSPVSMHRDNSW
jgi:hypothetical protein